MRVKRYIVDSMPDALQKIKTDLGKDAVILNTKEIRSGGFLGMFSKKKIEVIAAIDTTAAAAPSLVKTTAPIDRPQPVSTGFNTPQTAKNAYGRPNGLAAQQQITDLKREALAFPEVPDVLIPSPAVPAKIPAAAVVVKAREDMLMEELKQMKEFMHKLSVQGSQQVSDPSLIVLKQRMIEQEVEPLLVDDIITSITQEAQDAGLTITDDSAMESARKKLLELFNQGQSNAMAADTRIAHFVGPTGVGKTTTIAKLAAEQVLKYHRKVGFITSDTYRIAAVEQLKTYATILNVPLEVVFSPQDLSKAFEQLKDRDIIFMDTAGRNFRNEMYVSELNTLLQYGGKSETYLVLSLTTKYKDMKAITENFSKFKLDKVLFTKMDETDSYGAVVNLVHDFKLQLSYVANGQSVPDDINLLAEQHIVDLILGVDHHD
ncbi:flagellar biosynthesis protein FlhF [Paenibacillus sp. FSL H7-0331]|uniref:flagellar biosynthesis protein FlhF n=1 Tax=Paenibacillus sp. FSL H7-0331 TaxID=1920421 RepID=UPI00096C0BC9|nr:flagellar biosynthesis protein FlhF [Paenibacillus sp. FSL H7-0331]OMF14623.1 flagellar biosynthesis protein FlhF [Paenibacillus sp. FSL H7-0331]